MSDKPSKPRMDRTGMAPRRIEVYVAREDQVCGRCEEWDPRNLPAGTAANMGRCRIKSWDKPAPQLQAWDERPCVLFFAADNQDKRNQWINQFLLTQQQKETAQNG